jgi:hypothetical protein
MAMMKYGRASKAISSMNKIDGDPPVNGGTSTTPKPGSASKSWNDYANYVSKKKANEAAQSAYEYGLGAYERDIKFYNEGPELPKENPGDIKVRKGGKTRKGQDVTFDEADRYSASQANANLERARKENPNIVDINDKSINPISRKIWMEQIGNDIGGLDLYGRQTGKKYVNREAINKIKSNVDIYGEPFDMREWRQASESKDPNAFGKYLDQKGLRGRTIVPKEGMGMYNEYAVPKPPEKPVIEDNPPPPGPPPTVNFKIGSFNIPIPQTDEQPKDQKPTLSKDVATKFAIRKGMKSEVEVPKEVTWEPPKAEKTKKTIIKSGTVEASGEKGASGGRSGSVNKSIFSKRIKTNNSRGGYGIQTEDNVVEVPGGRKYKREQRLAKSFYAPTSELGYGSFYDAGDQGFDDQGRSVGAKKIVKSKIKDIRSDKREFRRETDMTGEEKRAKLDLYNADLKQGRESKRYTSLGKLTSAGGTEWQAGNRSKLQYFTPDRNALNPTTRSAKKALKEQGSTGAMSGYISSAQSNVDRYNAFKANEEISNSNANLLSKYGKNTKAEEWYQKAEDNAANKNTVIAQMEKYKGWGSKIK